MESELAALDLVLFSCGPVRVGVEARQVRAARGLDHGLEPGSQRDVAHLLGLNTSVQTVPKQIVLIKGPAKDQALQVDGPIELVTLPSESIHPLPALLAARTSLRHLRGLAMTGEGAVLLVDIQALLA